MVEETKKHIASVKGDAKRDVGPEMKKSAKISTKKLDDIKETPENKAAIAEAEGKISTQMNTDKHRSEKKEKVSKKDKEKEVVELEREYIVPLRRGFLKVPRYRRAKKAVRVLKEFMVRHMGVRDRDLGKVKIDGYLNNEIWFRGIKKPVNKIKVRAKKVGEIVYVELAEIPDVVAFAKAREIKRKLVAEKVKPKKVKVEKEEKSEEEKVEEKEDVAAGAEKAARVEKAVAKEMKHTARGKHAQKVMPVRKALKK